MKTLPRLAAIALAMTAPGLPVLAQCLAYESPAVSLSGKLVRRTYSGPPNYQSVRSGDRPETYWLLELDKPICVASNANSDGLEPAEHDIREVQLTVASPIYESHQGLLGKRVVAVGRLFHGISGHHHTPVLMAANSVEAAP